MEVVTSTAGIAQEIQLSIAPVFLLTSIAAVLTVLSGRLGRIIDRARAEEFLPDTQAQQSRPLSSRMSTIKKRIWLIQLALRLCVSSALLVCVVIVAIFAGDYVTFDLSLTIASLFVLGMLTMITGLILFLLEVGMATRETQRDMRLAIEKSMAPLQD